MQTVVIILAVILVIVMGVTMFDVRPSRIRRRPVVELPVRRRRVVEKRRRVV